MSLHRLSQITLLAHVVLLSGLFPLFGSEPHYREGEKVRVLCDTPLMDRSRTLQVVKQGSEFEVERIEGNWVLVTVTQATKLVPGWIAIEDIAHPVKKLQPEVWLISTRRAPLCGEENVPLDCWYLSEDHCWEKSNPAEFLQGDDPKTPTLFFVHGNRTSCAESVNEGNELYQYYSRHADGRAFRLVIWSWPSDRIGRRNRPDVQIKADRADVQSYYLARFISRIRPEVPLGFVGYSFGARAISGALQLVGGGELDGRCLPQPITPRIAPVRAVLIASALDADWLSSGHRNGLTLGQLDRVLITRNFCDSALKWYSAMYHRGGPPALGFVGPQCLPYTGKDSEKVELQELTCFVGKTHDWGQYFQSIPLQDRLAWYAFLEEPRRPDSLPSVNSKVAFVGEK
jgi:hypothetical protein